jgi:hypothetical protein
MNPQARLPIASLESFCRKWGIREMSVFGSVLRDDYRGDSDIDFLVTYREGGKPEWPVILDLEEELAKLVGRSVDVVERRLVEASRNYIKRKHILSTAETVYAEG